MTASAPDPRPRRLPWAASPPAARALAVALPLLALLASACAAPQSPGAAGSAFEALATRPVMVPEEADRAAAAAARDVLRDDADAAREALRRLVALEPGRDAGQTPSGLVPHTLDALNAMQPPGPSRRQASRALLARDDLPPALRARLEAEVEDDPLRLADARLSDARTRTLGTVVNGVLQPLGRSIGSAILLPYRLGQSLLGTALELHQQEELTLPERQALAHWKRFVEENPDSPEAAALLQRIEETQAAWYRTRRDREVKAAEDALEGGEPLRALAHAERALRYRPEDPQASELREEAEARARRWQEGRERSVQADPAQPPQAGERELAVALLRDRGVEEAARALLAEEGEEGARADEARLALAWAQVKAGAEAESWETLEELADEDPAEVSAARHARALLESPQANPARAFDRARRTALTHRVREVVLGPLAYGARDRDLPRPVEWLVEIPSLAGLVLGLPNRLVRAPFAENRWTVPAVLARRYLERFPDGARAGEMRDWLIDYEKDRDNHVGALRLAEAVPDTDPERLGELRERAAEQALRASKDEQSRDVRRQLLAETAREFRGTEAGAEAGRELRTLLETATPQQIRVSRGFLRENPVVAGPRGLGLRQGLLDGVIPNGELHPEGVTLLGGRGIEIAFVGQGGRERAEPERVRERISEERLARVVALLEERWMHTLLTDRDARVEHDADRDRFFERARLGLADRVDTRAHAESTYSFLGMREKYGLVRGRESILPVEIVLQGSFEDFGLGAFPRIRMPKPTPDAFLYR